MQVTLALVALAASAYAQDCLTSTYTGTFSLNPVNVSSAATKRSLESRQSGCASSGALVINLNNGVLTDSKGRIGSIVANYQFQFDGPPAQAGALVTSGYSICGNNTLATNGQAVWYQCSDLTRTSIYGPNLTPIGASCYQVYYEVIPCSGSPSSASQSVSVSADGQPGVTAASSCVPITTMSDGQPVVSACPTTSSCVPITTLSDGQPVVSSCPTTSSCVPITTLSDGQPVVSSCPTSVASCVPITTLSDGQPVVSSCPTSTSSCLPITTMSDGQPVVVPCSATSVPAATAAVVGQSSDGQVAATGGIFPSATPSGFLSVNEGSSLQMGSQVGAAVVGAFAVLFL